MSMTLPAFARRYFSNLVPADDGFFATCPVCERPHALRLLAWPGIVGAAIFCECGADTDAIAERLHVPPTTLYAHLASVRPATSEDTDTAEDLDALVLPRSALATLPPPEPLIADTINRRTLCFVAGAPASHKSFLLLAWSAHIATGTTWLGRHVEKGRVLFIAGEGAYGLHDRLTAWEDDNGLTIPDDGLVVFSEALQITDDKARAWLCERVAVDGYDLVIIDTLARSAVGLDESSSSDMGRFVAAADEIVRAMDGGSVIVAHHSSKAGSGLRGSSALEGAADTVYLTSKRSDGHVLLVHHKNKYGPDGDVLELEPAPAGPSIVLRAVTTANNTTTDTSGADLIWRTLDLAYGNITEQPMTFTRSEARALCAYADKAPEAERIGRVSRATFNRVFRMYVDMKVIAQVDTSARQADRYYIDREVALARHLPMHHLDLALPSDSPSEAPWD